MGMINSLAKFEMRTSEETGPKATSGNIHLLLLRGPPNTSGRSAGKMNIEKQMITAAVASLT